MEGEGVGLSEGPGGAALAIAESTKRALMQNFLIVATDEAPELPLPVAHAGLTPQEVRREERLRRSRSNDVYGRILEASKQIRELPLSGVDDEVGMIYVPRDEVIAQVRKVLLAHDIVYNLVERTHKQSGVLTESWTTHVFQKPSPAPRKGARRRKKSEDELRIKWYSQAVDTMGPNGPAKATSLAQKHVFLSTFMIPTTLDPETQRAALSPPPPVERLDARQTLRRILSIMNRYRAQLDEEQLGEMFTQAGIDAPEHIQHLEQLTLEQRRALLQVLRRRYGICAGEE
jgi:hypothetical protein